MHDQRCVRFASLGQIEPEGLQLATDVWLQDALSAPWATKDTMKLAGVLAHYILAPSRDTLNLKSMEDVYQLNADSARRALVLFSLYGLVDAYSTENNELRAALRLSKLQMLRVLKTTRELEALGRDDCVSVPPQPETRWVPAQQNVEQQDAVDNAGLQQASGGATAGVEETPGQPQAHQQPEPAFEFEPQPQVSPRQQQPASPEVGQSVETELPRTRLVVAHEQDAAARVASPPRPKSSLDEAATLSGEDALTLSLRRLQARAASR